MSRRKPAARPGRKTGGRTMNLDPFAQQAAWQSVAIRRATALLQHSSDRGRLLSEGNFRRLYLRLLADKPRSRPQPQTQIPPPSDAMLSSSMPEPSPVALLFTRVVAERLPASRTQAASAAAGPTAELRRAYRQTLTAYRTKVLSDA